MKNVRNILCTLPFTSFRVLWPKQTSIVKEDLRKPQEKTRRGKNTKSARAIVPGVFSGRRSKDFRKHHTKEKKPCH